MTYAGPDQGKGARVEWTSNERSVGQGSMEIADSAPNRRVDLAVNFNDLEGATFYDLAPSGSGTKVSWGFSYDTGTNPLRRWKGLMLDRFVGTDFQIGLADLKERIEAERRSGRSRHPPAMAPQASPSERRRLPIPARQCSLRPRRRAALRPFRSSGDRGGLNALFGRAEASACGSWPQPIGMLGLDHEAENARQPPSGDCGSAARAPCLRGLAPNSQPVTR